MSSTAMKWARAQKIGSASIKSVLNAIAARSDSKGTTFAAQATLAQDIGMTERNLRTHLKLLDTLGVIARQRRSKGRFGRSSDLIVIALHKRFDLSAEYLRTVRQRLSAESSNRKKSTLPTGRRLPGNTKRITYNLIQGGTLPYQGKALGKEEPRQRPALAVVNGSWTPDVGNDL